MDSMAGAQPWAWLLCHLLGMSSPVGFVCWAASAGHMKGSSLPCDQAHGTTVLCSPKGRMGRLGTAWVTATLDANRSTGGNGHQSHCYSKAWAPQSLQQQEWLSCWHWITPSQMSQVRLWWQHGPRLVRLIWVLLSWGVCPHAPGGQVAGAGNTTTGGVLSSQPHCTPAGEGLNMAFRVLRPSVFSRASGGTTGNQAAMRGMKEQQVLHLCQRTGMWSPCVTGGSACGRELTAIFPSCWVRVMHSVPTALVRAARPPFPAALCSAFITIFLPPHLFDITYSVWKYCPFCPLLHHLLTQTRARVCVSGWDPAGTHRRWAHSHLPKLLIQEGEAMGDKHTLKRPAPR